MSSTALCRLCICSYNEYKSLCDDQGQGNEFYEITVKYFDPMILYSQQYPKLAIVICMKCWHHIQEFHVYQQSVLRAQTKLEKDVEKLVPLIKLEDGTFIETEPIINSTVTEEKISNDIFNNMGEKTFLTDLDLSNIKDDNPFSTDDEQPLVNRLQKNTNKKFTKQKSKFKRSIVKDKEQMVQKRVRKTISKNEMEAIPNKSKSDPKQKEKRTTKVTTKSEEPSKDIESNLNEDNGQDSSLFSNDDSGDYDTDDKQLDADAFMSSNDQKKTGKQKNQEIDDFIAEWKQELECILCNSFQPNITLLRKHFRQEHPNKKCFVSCCQRKLHHRFHIVEHIRLHINPETFKCGICGKCSSNSRNLTKHMKDKHTAEGLQRRFECNICHKRFIKKCTLNRHLETHETGRDYQCTECGKGFATEQRRKVHERMVHNVDRICDQCGKTIHGIYALKQHVLEHAGITKRKWPCDQCNAELNSHSSLKRHKSLAHHDGSTVYVCSECGKIAPTETALRSHKKYVHQSERKYKCTICDKGFKVAIVLREHMATHTGEDLYQCPHCPKTFKVNANMHHHRKKAHPKEWAEASLNKPIINKVNVNLVLNEIVI